jgi:hypothetical protein
VFSPVVAWCERECETRQLKPHRGEWKAESGLTWMPLVLTIRGDGPELAPTASYVCDQGTYLGVILGTSEADFNQFQRERFEELLQEITEESARVDATLEQQRQARAAGGAA